MRSVSVATSLLSLNSGSGLRIHIQNNLTDSECMYIYCIVLNMRKNYIQGDLNNITGRYLPIYLTDSQIIVTKKNTAVLINNNIIKNIFYILHNSILIHIKSSFPVKEEE